MAYSKEVVSKARARLAAQKADRESQNQARLAEGYEKLPRLRQIDMQLRQSMASAAQAIFTGGGDVAAAIEQAKNENLALQKERQEMIRGAFPEGYLDETPICQRCGGSGYLGSTMCACLEALCREEQLGLLGAWSRGSECFENFRLDLYSDTYVPQLHSSFRTVMEKNLINCKRYAKSFSLNAGNLMFSGGTGLGKTFLALSIAKEVAAKGYSVGYETAVSLFNKLERAKFNPTEETRQEADRLSSVDLLVIDDLGTEMPGQFVTAALYGLLNDRLLAGKPMIITTNLNVDEAAKRYSPQIASRLYGDFVRLTFVGSDIRVLKNKVL